MDRSARRELAFKFLYSIEIQKDIDEDTINLFMENNEITDKKAIEYVSKISEGINKQKEEITSLISDNLKKEWTISRVSKVNISLLKLAIYEILFEKLPFKVVINEVVELAKKYGEDQSASFINGVLANIVKEK